MSNPTNIPICNKGVNLYSFPKNQVNYYNVLPPTLFYAGFHFNPPSFASKYYQLL